MILEYLEGEKIGNDVRNKRESSYFNDATEEARKRDKNHPDNLSSRFDIVTHPDNLQALEKGFSIFQKLGGERDIFKPGGIERYTKELENNIPNFQEIFSQIGRNLSIANRDTKTQALVIYGGPIEEVQGRTKDGVYMIRNCNPEQVIVSGGDTKEAKRAGFPTEAEYLVSEMEKQGIKRDIKLENQAEDTGENAKLIEKTIKGKKSVNVVTTDYDSLRVALTNQCQLPFEGTKRTHGAPFTYNSMNLWDKNNWWLTENGWRATMYAVSRLVNYRARTDPFL